MVMRPLLVGGALLVGLTPSLAATASPTPPPSPSVTPVEMATDERQGPAVTRRGTVHRIVTDGPDGGHTVERVLRSAGRTIPLRGAGQLAVGQPQSVTGSMDAGRLTVVAARPLGRAVLPRARSTPKIRPATGRERALVLPVKYNARRIDPDDYPFRIALTTVPNRWIRMVSGGRLTMRSEVAPWLVVSRAEACHLDRFDLLRKAKKAAKRRGIRVASFDRYLVYRRCPMKSGAEALTPGNASWYYGTLSNHFGVHELGHNFGLRHASSIRCRHRGSHSMLRGTCKRDEYGDDHDVMGGGSTRLPYNAAFLDALGWPSEHVTLSAGTQVITTTSKQRSDLPEAVRIPGARGTSYWIQTYYPPHGAIVRRYRGGATDLLRAHDSWEIGHELKAGSSFTTPEGIRIRVDARDDETLSVSVEPTAGDPAAPATPRAVEIVDTFHEEAFVYFEPPVTDNGAPVHHYEITFPGHEDTTLSWGNEDPTDIVLLAPSALGPDRVDPDYGVAYYSIVGLDGRQPTHAEVRAVNEYGTSAPGSSATFTPVDYDADVTLGSPTAGQRLAGLVAIEATVVDPPDNPHPADGWSLYVDGEPAGLSWHPGDPAPLWDTSTVHDGTHTLQVRAYQSHRVVGGRSPMIEVEVDNPSLEAPTLPDGSTIAGEVRVPYVHETPGWTFDYAWAELQGADGSQAHHYFEETPGGEYVDLDVSSVQDGRYALIIRARGTDPDGGTQHRSLVRQVVVDNVEPVITVLRPRPGTVIRRAEVPVRYAVDPPDWPERTFQVVVNQNWRQNRRRGEPLSLDVRDLPNGKHYFQVMSTQDVGEFLSEKVPVTVRR